MRRRTPVAVLVVAAAAALAVRGCGEPAPAAPNVLLVVVDTLRQDRLGVYGYDRHPTSPTLDAFARDEAVVVEGLTAVSSWTLPSMATLFTGLGPARHGVMRLSGEAGSLLEPRTLAQELRRAGYATGCVQGNFLLRRSWGAQLDRGFDSYDDSVIGPEAHRGSTAAEVASRGLAWIEGRPAGQPWFLALQFFDPHVAYEDHAEYAFEDPDYRGWVVGGLGGKELRDQLDRVGPADRRQLDAFYDEEVRAVDDALGRVLAALRARPDWQDTIVVFTPAYGEELAGRGWSGHTPTPHFEQFAPPPGVRLPGAAAARGRP
ncbi:MAG: sulfatase, partial [Planctomycetes bacterium]|nr:sulfatase [Planctomycetota bacterium]